MANAAALTQARTLRLSHRTQQWVFLVVVFAPMIAYFATFIIVPLIMGLWGSFTDWRGFGGDQPFVGLRNYSLLLQDRIFLRALQNTFVYVAMYLPATIVLSLGLALAIEATGVFKSFFRMVYFMPVVTSTIATALVWAWLYQPSFGLFNQLLRMGGLPEQTFLRSTDQALPSIVAYALWKNVGYNMVLFIAGLTTIDSSYYDAAKVDGAGPLETFWYITLPLLRPTLALVSITSTIDAMKLFGPVLVMTTPQAYVGAPGGPANATMVLSLYQWLVAFRESQLGYGSAMGIVLFAIMLTLTLVQLRSLRVQWQY
jgi:multiple sugar transport system permease protein